MPNDIDIHENHILQLSGEVLERLLADRTTGRHITWATRIIYLIATRFILGFDPSMHPEQSNFRQVDTVPYAKEGRLEELIEDCFGR